MVFGITVYFSWLLKPCNKERKVLVFCNDQLRSNHFLSFFFAFKFRGELVVFAQSYLKTVSVSKRGLSYLLFYYWLLCPGRIHFVTL